MTDIKAILKLIREAEKSADKHAADVARKYFGVTDNPMESGYVMPDGRMLDFSGRHMDDNYEMNKGRYVPLDGNDAIAGQRELEHTDIEQLYGGGLLNVQPDFVKKYAPVMDDIAPESILSMVDFMERSRAIRMAPEVGEFSTLNYPSSGQWRMINRVMSENKRPGIELWAPGGKGLGFIKQSDEGVQEKLLRLVDKYKRYEDGGEVNGYADGGKVEGAERPELPSTAYDDLETALQYMNDPNVPMADKMRLAAVMPQIQGIVDTDQRVDDVSAHSRAFLPDNVIRALVQQKLSTPRAPTGDDAAMSDRSAQEDAVTQSIGEYEDMVTPDEPWYAGPVRATSALWDAAPEIGVDMAQYVTPLVGNLRGAMDLADHYDEYRNAAQNGVDPLTANLMFIPNAAMDVGQVLMPFSAIGAARAAGRKTGRAPLNEDILSRYLQ